MNRHDSGSLPAASGGGAPVSPEISAVLREISALRSGLEVDLSVAAGALDACSPSLAASVLSAGRRDVAAVERRVSGLLVEPVPPQQNRPVPAAAHRAVAAAGAVTLMLSLLLAIGSSLGKGAVTDPGALPSAPVSERSAVH
jgi:hypothetical protein